MYPYYGSRDSETDRIKLLKTHIVDPSQRFPLGHVQLPQKGDYFYGASFFINPQGFLIGRANTILYPRLTGI